MLPSTLATALIALLGSVVAGVIVVYLPEHRARYAVAAAVLLASFLLAALVGWVLSRFTLRTAYVTLAVMVAVLIVPVFTSVGIGRFTYARFGLAVYGVIPLPGFDMTVNRHGMLWFRPKSHLVELNDVRGLLADDLEVLVIGTGWEERVRVEEAISDLPNVEVRILPTPQAFDLFNQLKSSGTVVALLAHGTC